MALYCSIVLLSLLSICSTRDITPNHTIDYGSMDIVGNHSSNATFQFIRLFRVARAIGNLTKILMQMRMIKTFIGKFFETDEHIKKTNQSENWIMNLMLKDRSRIMKSRVVEALTLGDAKLLFTEMSKNGEIAESDKTELLLMMNSRNADKRILENVVSVDQYTIAYSFTAFLSLAIDEQGDNKPVFFMHAVQRFKFGTPVEIHYSPNEVCFFFLGCARLGGKMILNNVVLTEGQTDEILTYIKYDTLTKFSIEHGHKMDEINTAIALYTEFADKFE